MEWSRVHVKTSRIYSEKINVERGCTQGDIDSPIIFNILIDAVLRKFFEDPLNQESESKFYADNRLIENENPKKFTERYWNLMQPIWKGRS